MLVGHAHQQQAWRTALASGRLHHAWLLTGPAGVGKASFADWAARIALDAMEGNTSGARLISAGSHPDYRLVQREVWDRSNPPRIVPNGQRKDDDQPARSIRISQVRALEPILALAPSLSARRIVVIDAADDLERPAANALLKMLEEPPRDTIFLLVSHASGRLLPTLRSRCRLLRFEPLSPLEVEQVLKQTASSVPEEERSALVPASKGSPGAALALAGAGLVALDAAMDRIARGEDVTYAERAALARSMAGKAASAQYQAFLRRAPAQIFERAKLLEGQAFERALEHWQSAVQLATIAIPQSLVSETVALELTGYVAALADTASDAKF